MKSAAGLPCRARCNAIVNVIRGAHDTFQSASSVGAYAQPNSPVCCAIDNLEPLSKGRYVEFRSLHFATMRQLTLYLTDL
jgi:hypothetical protein